ncbi:MAG: succinate dehydrogenase, hydrophobic membrane anchor protein [Pseudomonadota bacterium]
MVRKPVELDGTGYRGQRTALKTIRGLGSARSGTEHFIQQRVTAIANFALILVLVVVAIALSGKTYAEAVAFVGSPFVAVPLALAIISVCIHMKLGVQVVIEDYVHAEIAKMLLLLGNTFFALAIIAVSLFSIGRIMLQGLVLGAG